MNPIAARARVGRWVDTSAIILPSVAAELVREGFGGAFRYAPLPGLGVGNDLSELELAALVGAGLQVGLVQHVRLPGWRPADHSGSADALVAIGHAQCVGYPRGAVVYLDIEGVVGTDAETARFANDWCDAIRQAGQQPGIYCGYQDPLGPRGLYTLHSATTYWIDAGPRTVAVRGHAVQQRYPEVVIAGTRFDVDDVAPDLLGDLPWIASAA